jgi:uncharacterized membrane protein
MAGMENRTKNRLLLWIMANIIILISVPILYYVYLDRLVDYEYATGVRTSTGGDIILIPVAGVFLFLLLILLVINTAVACVCWWSHHRRRAS